MRIGTNFNTDFFKIITDINKVKYGEDFFITHYHKFVLLKKIFWKLLMGIIILAIIPFAIYKDIIQASYLQIILLGMIPLGALFVGIVFNYWKFKLSFIVVHTDAIEIYEQSSIFERKVFAINTNTITSIQVTTPDFLGTFLRFGTLEIFSTSAEPPFHIDNFPDLQKNQLIIRKYIDKQE